jgi:BirA family transcriptional regulator, biotin operon repressor / biotin---[acetyl-CoA-carboxylase] ligase
MLDPSVLDLERLQRELGSQRFGRSLSHCAETGSTNDDARHALAAGLPNGHVIVADAQTKGRGSRGRTWESPPDSDLYLSIIDRLPLEISELPPLTLAVGLGVADCVDMLLSAARAQVKWPNDVLIAGKKCSGVLLETSVGRVQNEGVVIGIGLNVNRTSFPSELADSATSLRLARPQSEPLERTRALSVLLECVERRVDQFVSQGAAAIAEELTPRLAYVGKRVSCPAERGWLRGVSPSGALLLETAHGLRTVIVGPVEVELLENPRS